MAAPCDQHRRAKCKAEHPNFLEYACSKCKEYQRPEEVEPYGMALFRLYRLQKGGFRLGTEDLDLETWDDLALLTAALDQQAEQRRLEAVMVNVLGAILGG